MLVVVLMLHLFQTFLEVTRGLVRLMLDKLYLSVQRQVVMLQILKIVFLLGLVLVAGLEHVGAIRILADWLSGHEKGSLNQTAFIAGLASGIGTNIVNNLPLGLLAGAAGQAAQAPDKVMAALLIGVDLGPNLSVTGSLATLLWLLAIRREGQHVGVFRFLKLGALVMPPALFLALAALVLV